MPSPNELSFLPDDYLERKAQRRTNLICAMLFLVVMVAIGSAFTYTERQARAVERLHEQVEREYTEAAKRIQLVQQLQEKQRKMAQQAEVAASLLEKVPRSYLLAEITNALPPGTSLLDLSLESRLRPIPKPVNAFEQKRNAPKPAQPPAAKDSAAVSTSVQTKVYDVYLKVTGIAYTDVQVAQFISKLNQSKLLKDVNLLISDEYKESGQQPQQQTLRKFQIEAMLDPAAEVTPGDKPGSVAVEIK